MSDENMLHRIGVITTLDGSRFFGSCFTIGKPQYLMTAAHCVAHENPEDLSVDFIRGSERRGQRVTEVHLHPSADLAILYVPSANSADGVGPYMTFDTTANFAVDIGSFGYVDEGIHDGSQLVVAKAFRGYIHRHFPFTDLANHYRYRAIELSFACPVGISGAPVFNALKPEVLHGVVTGTHESSVQVHKVSEVSDDGTTFSEVIQKVTQYGTAVYLSDVMEWVVSIIPLEE